MKWPGGGRILVLLSLGAFALLYRGLPPMGTRLTPDGSGLVIHHPPAPFRRHPLASLPSYTPMPGRWSGWQIDLRSRDVSGFDLSGRLSDLRGADFDSKTIWPRSLPSQFPPVAVMEAGKNPGLGVRKLHRQGITGKGVGIGIIDSTLMTDHAEYRNRLRLYEEIHDDDRVEMHGPAVASIAVGKTVGVAPQADLYYIAEEIITAHGLALGRPDLSPIAAAIRRLLQVNRTLPADRKIRVISISVGWDTRKTRGLLDMPREQVRWALLVGATVLLAIPAAYLLWTRRRVALGVLCLLLTFLAAGTAAVLSYRLSPARADAVEQAIAEASREGVFVITTAVSETHGVFLHGLDRDPLNDPDLPNSYGKPLWVRGYFDTIPGRPAMLLVPMASRCTASPTGVSDYAFYREGGLSWAVPYAAGLYALACQVRPDITPQAFWSAALETGDTTEVKEGGTTHHLGKIVNPPKLIEHLR